jgi:hypothetical protein
MEDGITDKKKSKSGKQPVRFLPPTSCRIKTVLGFQKQNVVAGDKIQESGFRIKKLAIDSVFSFFRYPFSLILEPVS